MSCRTYFASNRKQSNGHIFVCIGTLVDRLLNELFFGSLTNHVFKGEECHICEALSLEFIFIQFLPQYIRTLCTTPSSYREGRKVEQIFPPNEVIIATGLLAGCGIYNTRPIRNDYLVTSPTFLRDSEMSPSHTIGTCRDETYSIPTPEVSLLLSDVSRAYTRPVRDR